MEKFIRTQIVEAEQAYLVVLPSGEQFIRYPEDDAPVGSECYRGVVVDTGFADEDGKHVQWIPEDAFEEYGLMPLFADPDHPDAAPSVSTEMVDRAIVRTETKTLGDKTTVVRATLWNGFEIVEASSCVCPENYDVRMGEAICLDKIRDKVWMLLGFLLQSAVAGR